MPRTRRVDCTGPGLRRVRRGRGFSYHEEGGEKVVDPAVIERITALAIPPAWTEVWICSDPRGHVQATGIDAAGRKQYRYHDDWRAHRDRQKFDRMLRFALRLPGLRERVEAGLAERGLAFDRVCAAAVALLDLGLFRIGSERYESENESYGLTTLKVRHVSFGNGAVEFEYPAKSGQLASHAISDPVVIPVLQALVRRGEPDDYLLTYRRGRSRQDLDPEDVNDWIKETAGEDFSAKDFRTWNATVVAAEVLALRDGEQMSKAARKRTVTSACREVAKFLNNTPAVCRASYIDPRVFDRFDSGETIAPAVRRIESRTGDGRFADREAIERAVVRLIEDG
ncbi:MAG: DNA topoisomerase IB [Solirubrobacterales bacterium]|nr:DNA topoisomerase IB [Solirubrobacterales bacterium]